MTTTFPPTAMEALQNSSSALLSDWIFGRVEWLEQRCESPIEVLLGLVLDLSFYLFPEPDAVIFPQYEWENYRIDFCLHIPRLKPPDIFIECDGHDFHERTKEQAANDRMKDRKIQEAGIPILRFTGSEIFRDAAGCVDQIRKFAFVRAKQQQGPEA